MGGLDFVAQSIGVSNAGPAPVSKEIVRNDGKRLNFLDWGGDGPPVVFLHGGALSAHTWTMTAMLLRERYRCIAVDLRGHGDSEWADSYHIEDHVDDIHCLIAQLDLQTPHIVGMSLGGVVSAYTCLQAKAFTPKSLTLVDVAPGVSFKASAQLRDFIGADVVKRGAPALVKAARRVGARNTDAQLHYRYATLVRQDENGNWRWKHDDREPFDFDHVLSKLTELNDHAVNLTIPCLIVRGGLSKILNNDAATDFAEKCPNGEWCVVPNAGHSVQEDNPVMLAETLIGFWARRISN